MKLKEDLLERVRKGELIVKNDNDLIIDSVYRKVFHDSDCLFLIKKHKYKGFFVLPNDSSVLQWLKKKHLMILENFCQEKIIKASELIEKEDYTKPLEEGQLCVFWDYKEAITIDTYDYFDSNQDGHISSDGIYFKNAMPITGKETIEEIQERISNYLKDNK